MKDATLKLDSYIEVHASCLVSASWVMRKRVKLHVSTSIAAAFPWCRRERRYNFFKKIKPPNISPVIGPPALKCSPCTKKFQVMMSTQALEVGGSRSNSSLPLIVWPHSLLHPSVPFLHLWSSSSSLCHLQHLSHGLCKNSVKRWCKCFSTMPSTHTRENHQILHKCTVTSTKSIHYS